MDYKEELKALVELVKRNSKRRKEKITQGDIAEKYGVTRTYLSDLISGKREVTKKHVDDFKLKLRDQLFDITPEMALLNVLMEDYAEYKSKNTTSSKEDIIKDIQNKANSKLAD